MDILRVVSSLNSNSKVEICEKFLPNLPWNQVLLRFTGKISLSHQIRFQYQVAKKESQRLGFRFAIILSVVVVENFGDF